MKTALILAFCILSLHRAFANDKVKVKLGLAEGSVVTLEMDGSKDAWTSYSVKINKLFFSNDKIGRVLLLSRYAPLDKLHTLKSPDCNKFDPSEVVLDLQKNQNGLPSEVSGSIVNFEDGKRLSALCLFDNAADKRASHSSTGQVLDVLGN